MADRYFSHADDGQRLQPGAPAEAGQVNEIFDRVSTGFQEAAVDTDRAIKLPAEGDNKALTENALQRRNKVVGFDADGNLMLLAGFGWRGNWTTATEYFVNDVFRDPATKNLYVTITRYTSAASVADDLAAGNIGLAISVEEVEAAREKAEQWAENPEYIEVETGKFSSLHHAAKSAASASASASSASNAAGSEESAAAAANFKGLWSTLTGSLSRPASVKHSGEFWELLNNLADVTASEPGASADWTSKTVLTGTATGPIDMAGNALTVDAVIYDTIDKGTVSTGTVSFDVQAATKQKLTVGGALTFELTNKPANDWELEIDLTNGGSAAITFPTVNWLIGDGTTSTAFADMGVTLSAAGGNTLLFWGTGSGDVYGRAG